MLLQLHELLRLRQLRLRLLLHELQLQLLQPLHLRLLLGLQAAGAARL